MKEGRPGGDREGAEMEIDKKRAAGGIQKDDELRSKQMDKRATVTERGGEEINERECTWEIRIGWQKESERDTKRDRLNQQMESIYPQD